MQKDSMPWMLARVLLWLPVCVTAWYLLTYYVNLPGVYLSGWSLGLLFPTWVESFEWANGVMSLVTQIKVEGYPGVPAGQVALLVIDANPSLYSYGLCLFVALMLASNGYHQVHKLLLGSFMLVPLQAWGISLDLLKQVAVTASPEIVLQSGFGAWQREAIALGYQFGSLILPTLGPVLIWLALNPQVLIPVAPVDEGSLVPDSGDETTRAIEARRGRRKRRNKA